MKSLHTAIMLFAICTLASLAADKNTNNSPAIFPLIKFEDVELIEVIENLASQAERNYLFDPKAGFDQMQEWHQKKQPRVSLSWTNLTAEQSLKGVLDYYGLQLAEIKGTTVSKITLTNQTAKPVDIKWIERSTNAIPLIQMGKVPLDDALRNLAKQAKLDIEMDTVRSSQNSNPGRSHWSPPILSLRWKSITARQAIAALCENYDLVMTPDTQNGTIHISQREQAASK